MTPPTLAGPAAVLAYIPSPPQGVWYLGPFPVRAYALCIIVGIIVAVWWGNRRWIARGGQEGEVLDIAIWAVPFGLLGGRLYHLATDWQTYFGDGPKTPMDALKIWDGGLGIWGAVALGGVGAWIGARRHGIKLPPFADAIAPPILLAQAIGRLGNYFNQELYGRETTVPWGLKIYERVDSAGNLDPGLIAGVSNGRVVEIVHPTFLYEMVWNLFVVVLLVLVDRYFRIGHGRLFALYVAGYCVGRFGVELMRSDPATHIAGLRINLFTAAVIFACAAMYFVVAPRGREQGLSMYRGAKADELEALGYEGYVEVGHTDDDDDEGDDWFSDRPARASAKKTTTDTEATTSAPPTAAAAAVAPDAAPADSPLPDLPTPKPDPAELSPADPESGGADLPDGPTQRGSRQRPVPIEESEESTVAPVHSASLWVLESEMAASGNVDLDDPTPDATPDEEPAPVADGPQQVADEASDDAVGENDDEEQTRPEPVTDATSTEDEPDPVTPDSSASDSAEVDGDADGTSADDAASSSDRS